MEGLLFIETFFLVLLLATLSFVAIGDCTHIGSATTSFKDLVTVAQENTTADSLIENQLQPILDKVTVDQERELHKPYRW